MLVILLTTGSPTFCWFKISQLSSEEHRLCHVWLLRETRSCGMYGFD